ncbi:MULTISPECIES: bifunctional RecB family nuclease/DEAD/DEAH box helicase [unclassified Curtobacterium]|uniref:TM0106 family RecB-like putative nuclease n=1 Tax=unclassified Curtobacterium TaxID=257496 RepID=UPI001C65143D|nr:MULTISPECIES: bifunctional RecB family nuclease/DEAD/DEAH box helicase [unclassified Curtobacterium]
MQLTTDGRVVLSPSDLSVWASCEWAFLRRLDAKLGRAEPVAEAADAMLDRTARLGDEHELRYLATLKAEHGADQVVEFERPDPDQYQQAAQAAADAMRAGVAVLYQATFHDPGFIGFSDFLIRNDRGEYEVYDTKLARHAKITALLQLAAYAEQIERLGIPVGAQVHLVLGDETVSSHDLADIAPVYRTQRDELRRVIDERIAASEPLAWGDPRYTSCGRCGICSTQVEEHRDLVLVAGMRLDQRARLIAAGVTSIDALATAEGPVPGVSAATLATLRAQARLQTGSERDRQRAGSDVHPAPRFEVVDPQALAAIPAPDAGDVFFDFEGDPLYSEDGHTWGLDYLFGLVDTDARFTAFWAHTIREERRALVDFLAFVKERRAQYPGMHVYHYASYERTHLLSLAARHGVGEDDVDDLLRENVLVDLYPIVRKALLVGSRSYSIKKLEPLYMGEDLRDDAGVTNAADSITAYVEAIEELRNGDPVLGQHALDQVADYNEYDCRSTLRLRDWLLGLEDRGRVDDDGSAPDTAGSDGASDELEVVLPPAVREPDPVYLALMVEIEGVDALDRTADQQAIALAAAAIDYHRREGKTFWQEHFDRLRNPIDEWADTRDVFIVEQAEVVQDWAKLPGKRTFSRELRLLGTLAPGSKVREGTKPHLVYDEPLPISITSPGPGMRGASSKGEVLDIGPNGDRIEILLKESVGQGQTGHEDLPVALTPAAPPAAKPQPEAIAEWGREVLDALPSMLPDPALDLLRRVPPRGGVVPLSVTEDDTVAAVVATLLGLDRSYLAIQGPPGTGKTYVGSHVVARLVQEHGWRVGVVGQSHATSENFLDAVVTAGVPADRVVKVPQRGGDPDRLEAAAWTPVKDNVALAAFLTGPAAGSTGRPGGVVGGTAWTFANANTVERRSLDLLVVDEAGQFSLAPTIASSVAASRLLLLGDPQQLPQVSQGSHPEPVDESALGWLADGEHVLPPEFGYFLAHTRRMHPALTAPVSRLSYNGSLTASEAVLSRSLRGLEPGLHVAPVAHIGNTTSSPEEAERVVSLASSVIGLPWTDGGVTRPLTDEDVIVVAPYNAQGALIRAALDAAGLRGTQVGTVDLFQGREAVVAIVSLAASSAAEIPRGLDFLLMPNRLNVAISRAKWAAFVVYSPGLTTALPTSIAGMALLSRFIELVQCR